MTTNTNAHANTNARATYIVLWFENGSEFYGEVYDSPAEAVKSPRYGEFVRFEVVDKAEAIADLVELRDPRHPGYRVTWFCELPRSKCEA